MLPNYWATTSLVLFTSFLLAVIKFWFLRQKTKRRVVEGIIYVEPILSGEIAEIINLDHIKTWIESITHFSKTRFVLELVAADLDSSCEEKKTVKANARYIGLDDEKKLFIYKCEFKVPKEFGEIGALLVENELHKEKYIKNIALDGNVIFTCESWIHSKKDNPSKRIFFTDKSYLPSQTPKGLKSLRKEDLESLRGNDKKERKPFERIYDYATYNDLGEPDISSDLSRPVLGGKEHPYPRRCRTGREMTNKESESESRKKLFLFDQFYVPRDEAFPERKVLTFGTMEVLFSIVQALKRPNENFIDVNETASSIKENINQGRNHQLMRTSINANIKLEKHKSIPKKIKHKSIPKKILEILFDIWVERHHLESVLKVVVPKLFGDLFSGVQNVRHIEDAQSEDEISFSWFRDEEFCRQTLAGINPYSIQLVTEWPLTSKLDPEVYGPAASTITKEIVEGSISHIRTLEEALKEKKLFLLDYHDLLLPYVNTVRELKGTTLYGSRTLMFLTAKGTLQPVAIELTRPPNNGKPHWNQVYIPCSEPKAKEAWLWKLAKAHVLAHDSGYHQLISHWLRTHCVTEPYIIATHRCLSKMHPIQRLLSPHFRYTMQINSLARLFLINAGGVIESTFFPGKYSMQLSSDVYAQQWQFDLEALPADLIHRGMAVEVPSEKDGIETELKLTIEDYPFAKDGLALWDAIKQWATSYVNHYYPQADLVASDEELQAWWTEIRTVGHGDKKDEPWWPVLKTQQDLIGIVSTIMWVSSGHHSAVNFGQYTAGYTPNRPTIARTKMPDEDPTDEEWKEFLSYPKHALRNCFPSNDQSKKVKSTLGVLSSHSPDEEYIGVNKVPAWEAEPAIQTAFKEFQDSLDDLGEDIDSRNGDHKNFPNRIGKGSVPYELLKPKSEPWVTGKGVPYSISI